MRHPAAHLLGARTAMAALLLASLSAILACTPASETGAPAEAPAAADRPGGEASMFELSSSNFEAGGVMPPRLATERVDGGANVSPALSWNGAPEGTRSFALAAVDRHPVADNWVHWLIVDIPSGVSGLPEDASGDRMPQGARELQNSFGSPGWGGPQPPPDSGPHTYEFTLYALAEEEVTIAEDASLGQFEQAIAGVTLGSATATGIFER